MKYDRFEQFAFIETRVYWGSGLTAQELGQMFGLARQTAQGVIKAYQQQHPGALIYDEKRKRQVAAPGFQPCYIRANVEAYLGHLRAQTLQAYYRTDREWDELPFCDVDLLLRKKLPPEPMRVIIAALQENRNVTMYYMSKQSAQLRDFSPNHLIFASNRYHVRGYCHLRCQYLDFVLSRIVHAEPSATEWYSSQDDGDWNTYIELHFSPHTELPEAAKAALRRDFPLDEAGIYLIRCRKALAYYIKRELMAVDPRYALPRWIIPAPRDAVLE